MTNSVDENDEREQRLDAIVAEYYRAEEAGKAPDRNEFIAQHPEFQQELCEFIADLCMLQTYDRHDNDNPAFEPAITHDPFVRLMDKQHRKQWNSRGYIFNAAAEAMRKILVERAAQNLQLRQSWNAGRQQLTSSTNLSADEQLVALDEALDRLAIEDPLAAKVVALRHFSGLGHHEVAAALGVTIYKAQEKWMYARAWLKEALKNEI